LDEVAAGVVQDGHHLFANVSWCLREDDARLRQPIVLGFDIVNSELSQRNPVFGERIPVWLHRGMTARFEQQFRPVWRIRGNDGQPEVVADWDVVAFHEAEYLGVERQRCSLIVDED
jgi:hypothetical protein